MDKKLIQEYIFIVKKNVIKMLIMLMMMCIFVKVLAERVKGCVCVCVCWWGCVWFHFITIAFESNAYTRVWRMREIRRDERRHLSCSSERAWKQCVKMTKRFKSIFKQYLITVFKWLISLYINVVHKMLPVCHKNVLIN